MEPYDPTLLPYPRRLTLTGGTLDLARGDHAPLIALNAAQAAPLLFSARQIHDAVRDHAGQAWAVVGGDGRNDTQRPPALLIALDSSGNRPDGYRLTITETDGIRLIANDAAGAFYGAQTLMQLVKLYGLRLPLIAIEDWPDFEARGVMLDISRDKVPTMATLYALIDLLASWKINQFQLYTEHTFAYRQHPEVWANASPLTADEILALDAYCRERFIDLVPNQNSFGHMHRWFRHERYLPLAETQTGISTPWGTTFTHPFSLSPAAPGVIAFLDGLYAELLPNFTSEYINVGCDETFDLGVGQAQAAVAERGKGRVYLDFLLAIYARVQAHGRTMMFWGDIIGEYPELVPELPKDAIALEWGYEATHDFPGKARMFAESGVPFYVCPGTSSWNTIAGRTDNMIGNIRGAVESGLENNADGVLNTDWGDNGHWQPLPVSYPGYAYGAALSWCLDANRYLDLPLALSRFAFRDSANIVGKLLYDLGNAYQQAGVQIMNSSVLALALQTDLAALRERASNWLAPESAAVLNDDQRLREGLHQTLAYIETVMAPLSQAQMAIPDGELVTRELRNAAHMLQHGAERLLLQLGSPARSTTEMRVHLSGIEAEYRDLWLARNRPGGLAESFARLAQAGALYTD
ncbi:MAG: family 20 glycosylhydrolase [Chloroflexi bacterium]|nr:family 20 glycosylhydrolase [Chloroflexota bacterium]